MERRSLTDVAYAVRFFPDTLFAKLASLVPFRPFKSIGNEATVGFICHVILRYIFRLQTVLILLWIWIVQWGERTAFEDSVKSCHWQNWEQWPSGAQPHHVAFIADPQLVDPHTYPGRPWPLSTATIAYTDRYMARSYRLITKETDPDSILFLGDLFDGGREWETYAEGFVRSEERWKPYGHKFWLQEYDRFGNIFFDPTQISGGLPESKDRKIVATLPGNHDLGFGGGVQSVVRNRFQAYFGEGNRIDIIGNHTFVSLDTVSLSAMDIQDAYEGVWNETKIFLDHAGDDIQKMARHHLSHQQNLPMGFKYEHKVVKPQNIGREPQPGQLSKDTKSDLPTVVLSHVPFYREHGTPCGPFRERSPPSAPGLKNDPPNGIRVDHGYGFQYQNVLSPRVTKLIAEKIGNIGHVFSGDDHDYCDVTHHAYPSAGAGIREITVKSLSWAMGVRKPGLILASLWNPIDEKGQSLGSKGEPTIQTHLCLLPDQIGILITYGIVAGLTFFAIIAHATVVAQLEKLVPEQMNPVLPTREPSKDLKDLRSRVNGRARASSGSAHGSSNGHLAPRSQTARARSVSPGMPVGGYGLPPVLERSHIPLIEQAGYYRDDVDEEDDWIDDIDFKPIKRRRSFWMVFRWQLAVDLLVVGVPALTWYRFLITTG